MDSQVTVSIITSFLNGERFFGEAVASIFAQTYRDWELILVDDGSTDSSTAFARRLALELPQRIFYLEHTGHVNRGLPASRNTGLRNARGKYVAFLDVDDVWRPTKLEHQVALLERYPDVAMAYGPLVLWHGWTGKREDEVRDYVCPMGSNYDKIIKPPAMLVRQIQVCDGLPAPCSVLLRRKAVEEAGGFDEFFKMYEDEVFFSKIALRWPVYVTSQCLDLYRQHQDSMSARAIASGEYIGNPNIPNIARRSYLQWLTTYLNNMGCSDASLLNALGEQISSYKAAGLWS